MSEVEACDGRRIDLRAKYTVDENTDLEGQDVVWLHEFLDELTRLWLVPVMNGDSKRSVLVQTWDEGCQHCDLTRIACEEAAFDVVELMRTHHG